MGFKLNAFTGKPLLEYLLALDGIESPILPVDRCRAAFGQFLALSTDSVDAGACFQVEIVTEGDAGGTMSVGLFRQLTDAAPSPSDESGTMTRLVGICWGYTLSELGDLESREIWAADCADLDAFWQEVTETPEWQFVVANTADGASVIADEDEAYGHAREVGGE